MQGVRGSGAGYLQGVGWIWGSPGVVELDELAVVGELELVDVGGPSCDLASGDGEFVGVGDEGERLHPGEITEAIERAEADEVGVDVEIGVGDEAEVLVLATVEVEHDAVSADDLWVTAHRPILPAIRCTQLHNRVMCAPIMS